MTTTNIAGRVINSGPAVIDRAGQPPMTCKTCDVVQEYTDMSVDFIVKLSDLLIGPMQLMFGAVIGIWIIIHGYKLFFGHADLAGFAKEFVFVFIAFIMLQSQGNGLISDVFSAAMTVMGEGSSMPFLVIDGGLGERTKEFSGMVRLVAFAEFGFYGVLETASTIIGTAGLNAIKRIVMALILIAPYFLLLIGFVSQLVVGIFRLLIVSAFSPFLVLCFGFGWGRQMFYAGLKTMLSAICVLFACSVAMGMIMAGVAGLEGHLEDLGKGRDLSFTDPAFLVPVFLGWMGTAFMAEATGIANSITGTFLSNQGAGIMTAGVTGSAVAAMKTPGAIMDAPSGLKHRASQLKSGGVAALGAMKWLGKTPPTSMADAIQKFNNPPRD